MSIEKQLRLLKQKPAIIVATPGRLWELMSEYSVDYLVKGLPMVDVLVLDEADRMIADGHFREMRDILAHIYTQRVKIKLNKKTGNSEAKEMLQGVKQAKNEGFTVGKNLEETKADIDWSQVQDLYDEDVLIEEIEENDNLVVKDRGDKDEGEKKQKKRMSNKVLE